MGKLSPELSPELPCHRNSHRNSRTQNNLGLAWTDLPSSARADNVQRAIAAYTAVLEVRIHAAHPVEWADTQNNLGLAWANLPTGDRSENLQQAVAAYTAALEVYTRAVHPVDWARTRCNLGLAYWDRAGLGGSETDGTADLTTAIAQVRAAAQVWTEVDFPFDYQNLIAPALEGLRTAWLDGGHGSAADFEAIAPAP